MLKLLITDFRKEYLFGDCHLEKWGHYFPLIGGRIKVKLRSKDIPDIIKNNNIFSIYYSGISAFRCLNVMYDDSNIFLDRKYLKYLDIFRKFNPE